MKTVAFLFVCVLLHVGSVGAQVRLNEILADPVADWDGDGSLSSKFDEWLEIMNVGASPVDLSCYRFSDASGGTTWRYGFSGMLAPGDALVVYGSEASAWQVANGFPNVGLSLNNGGDTAFLYEVLDGDTTIVEEYTYQPFEVLDDRAVGRNDSGEWEIFDALNPYSGSEPPPGNGCMPTPGLVNECNPRVPVDESTWGRVKHLFGG